MISRTPERDRTLSSGLRLSDSRDFRNPPKTPDSRRFREDNTSLSNDGYRPPSYGQSFDDSYDHGESSGSKDYVAKVENTVATEAARLQKGEKIYLKDLSVEAIVSWGKQVKEFERSYGHWNR